MIPDLKLDDRLRFYQEVINTLFCSHVSFDERLVFIQKHQVPMTLVAISSEWLKVRDNIKSLEEFERQIAEKEVLISTLDIEGFFDGWDVLLILAYIQYINNETEFLAGYQKLETSEIINTMAKRLFQVQEALTMSLPHLQNDIKYGGNSCQCASDNLYDLEETFTIFLYEYLLDCHDIAEAERTHTKILKKMKSLYCSLDPLEYGEFNNMYEHLGLILYYGSHHGLYDIVHQQIRKDIKKELDKNDFNQKLSLLNKSCLDSIVRNIDVNALEGIDDFKTLVMGADEFDKVIDDLKAEFLAGVPKYSPSVYGLRVKG